ncbi:MAG: AAA family ATPase [Syntrophobacteraceae bacterium]
MAIITISRGSYSRGKEVAEKVAQKLGYQCCAREVILDASKEFNIPEIKLVNAVHDAPSILERFSYGKEKFITYVQAALLKCVQRDNVVYHGLAGDIWRLQDHPMRFALNPLNGTSWNPSRRICSGRLRSINFLLGQMRQATHSAQRSQPPALASSY